MEQEDAGHIVLLKEDDPVDVLNDGTEVAGNDILYWTSTDAQVLVLIAVLDRDRVNPLRKLLVPLGLDGNQKW